MKSGIFARAIYVKESPEEFFAAVEKACEMGFDGIYAEDASGMQEDDFLYALRAGVRKCELPFICGCGSDRFETIKKAFYTGSVACAVSEKNLNEDVVKEGRDRFGKEKIFVSDGASLVDYEGAKAPLEICGISEEEKADAIKALCARGVKYPPVLTDIKFEDLKKDTNGLVPVIVQDYLDNSVLMMAYMNSEAFEMTLQTGRMTYFSRSRQKLWIKGETSGHFQYVKAMYLDCDSDTILAKVRQIGAACHTGNRSCFYTGFYGEEDKRGDIGHVLNQLMDVINDRKKNPKEGSYTNYLFDKGIDKILKKCGEESAEIIIAAKNPEAEELKYEIADYLYHLAVLMAECGLDWKDISEELANR